MNNSFSPVLLLFLAVTLLTPCLASGAGDLTNQQPVDITVRLGDEKDSLKFIPDTLEFETGKLYRLVLVNPSPQKHYFSSEGLSRAVFTRKVQINGGEGKPLLEVKGIIHEIEVYPKGTAEWWFVPVKTGTFNDLKCTISGHQEKGMTGRITIR
ncbi:MAG: biphenyl 2,3-dioxygenase [Nitrospirae bacterium]|nr:biphenyl 2,3-dioxygenase [Nitrospirota bacterium]